MSIFADLRYSGRTLARAPGLALGLLLTIALGIGANAAVLGFIRGSLAPDLPIRDVDRVVSVFWRDGATEFGPLAFDAFTALRARTDLFELLGAVREGQATTVYRGHSDVLSTAAVTPEAASVLGLPATGVLIGDHAWQYVFGGRQPPDPAEPMRIDGAEAAIAGIAPEWLRGIYLGTDVDLWVPLSEEAVTGAERGSRVYSVIGRLRSGVSIEDARTRVSDAAVVIAPYTGLAPDSAAGLSRIARLLPAAAGAIFLIACINVSAFLLSRAFARAHETSVRVALGAGRVRLATQLLADSVLISTAGGAAGILLAYWTARIVPALFFQEDADRLAFAPSLRAILAAAVACGAVTVVCGLMPLFEVRDDRPAAVLRRESLGPSTRMRRLRAALVVIEMTCCAVLVISAAVLLHGFRAALRTPQGSGLSDAVLVTVEAARRFNRSDLGLAYFAAVERAAQSQPGVFEWAWASRLPGSRPSWYSGRVEPADLPTRAVTLDVVAFEPATLERIVLPPAAGRMFSGADTRDSCRVAVINQEAARLLGSDVVGRLIHDGSGRPVEIIGVVATRRADEDLVRPTLFYYPEQTGASVSGPDQPFQIPVLPPPTAGLLDLHVVSPSWFELIGAPVTAGRGLRGPADRACRVAVVSDEAAQRYFGGRAVGGAVIDRMGRRTTVVGVVQAPTLRAAQRRPQPAIYLPMDQDFTPRMTLLLNVRDPPRDLLESLAHRLTALEGGARPPAVTSLDAHLRRTALAPERIAALLAGAAASLGLALGALGLYSAMADAVRHRRREIAVRLALGAPAWRVTGHVVAEGVRLAAAGTVGALLLAILVTRWLEGIAPGASAVGAWVWLAAPLALLAAVAAASVIPARRAVAVDPLTIMRE